MKLAGAAIVLLCACAVASAQDAPKPKPVAAKPAKPAAKPKAAEKPAAAGSQRAAYDALSLADRIALQVDLAWVGAYEGNADGEFKESSIAAVKTYQKDTGAKDTGILTPEQRAALAAAAQEKQVAAGWTFVTDDATGIRLGLPVKLVPQTAKANRGTHWQSVHGEIQIDTFRETPPATLAAIYAQQRKSPGRKIESGSLNGSSFILTGLQGLKKFLVRAQAYENEIRGFTIIYDQATEGTVDPIATAMAGTFNPFPNAAQANTGPAQKRKIEYSTGVVVSAQGAIVADREATDACQIISIGRMGNADRTVDDKAPGVALLRIYGVRDLKPLALGEPPRNSDVTLVGIPDPQSQGGATTAAAAKARPGPTGALDPAPAIGFAGAAVIDSDTGFAGIAVQKPQVVAGPPASANTLAIAPVDTIRRMMMAQSISPLGGRAPVEFAMDSVVRVICVRK